MERFFIGALAWLKHCVAKVIAVEQLAGILRM